MNRSMASGSCCRSTWNSSITMMMDGCALPSRSMEGTPASATSRSRRLSSRSRPMIALAACLMSRSSTMPAVWGRPRNWLNVDPPLKSRNTKCSVSGGLRTANARHQFCSSTDLPDPVVPATRACGPCAAMSRVATPSAVVPMGTSVCAPSSQPATIGRHITGSSRRPSTDSNGSMAMAPKSSDGPDRSSGCGPDREGSSPRVTITRSEAEHPTSPGMIMSTNIQRCSTAIAPSSISWAMAGATAAARLSRLALSRRRSAVRAGGRVCRCVPFMPSV